jgi:hypothetical protein
MGDLRNESTTEARPFVMPGELVNEDCEITWIRAADTTRGKAKAFFASEMGVDFAAVRVSKTYFAPPELECDECGLPATCGAELNWRDSGPAFKEKLCDECLAILQRREGPIGSLLAIVEPRTLKDVEPYDGWPVSPATRATPGAVAYWRGEVA